MLGSYLTAQRPCFAAALTLTMPSATLSAQLTYDGRNTPAGTGWRADAATMIDKNRKADIDLSVQLPDGTALPGASIHVAMQDHAFQFGSALDPRYFLQSQSRYEPTYAGKVEELFNTAVYENHTKWRAWNGDFGPGFEQSVVQEGLGWIADRGLDMRGHTMLWTGYDKSPSFVREMLDDIAANPTQANRQALYDATFDRIEDIADATAGQIYAWDMLNEPRRNTDIEDALIGFTPAGGDTVSSRGDLRARWFNAAKAAAPDALMMVNDFQIIPGGGLADTEPEEYKEQINGILNEGGVIEGIGFQSHFSTDRWKAPTAPRAIWELLDEFDATYDLPMHITEFDFATTDLALQADYTRDFMTAVFAHDAIEAFLLWGFWEGKMSNPEGALFDLDWNINPNGQAYIDLVFGEWWTDEIGDTDLAGLFDLRGFLGDYLITVEYDGQVYEFVETLGSDGLSRTYVIPEPATACGLLLLLGWVATRRSPGGCAATSAASPR
ncbi:MAG: endo-1,4-beta-xylanase [Planctomycetota bacterium]